MCVCVIVKMSFKARDNLLRSLSLKFYRRTEEEEEEEILSLSLSLSLASSSSSSGWRCWWPYDARAGGEYLSCVARKESLSLFFWRLQRRGGEGEEKEGKIFFWMLSLKKLSFIIIIIIIKSSSCGIFYRWDFFY